MFFCLLQNIHRIYSNFYLKNHQNKPLVIYYKLTCKWNGVVSSRAYRGLVITVRVASVPEVWTQGHLLFPGINGMHILIWLLTQCVVSWSDYTMLTFFFFPTDCWRLEVHSPGSWSAVSVDFSSGFDYWLSWAFCSCYL